MVHSSAPTVWAVKLPPPVFGLETVALPFDLIEGPFPGWNIALNWALIIFFILAHLSRLKREERTRPRIVEIALLYILGIGGFSSIISGFLHLIYGDELAESIGWQAGNPFQWEVGFANIALGVIGYMCFWRRDFWLPTVIARTIFAWGAGITHVVDIVERGNFAPGNAGPILYVDFLVPIVWLVLLTFYKRYEKAGLLPTVTSRSVR